MFEKKYVYDPEFAYLKVVRNTEERENLYGEGVYLKLPSSPFDTNSIAYSKWLPVKQMGTLERAFIEAKRLRNYYGPQIMGMRFMNYGSRPRQNFNLNTSGVIGVSLIAPEDSPYTAWRATWNQHVPGVAKRVQRGKDFPFNILDFNDERAAFEDAVAYRKAMIKEHYRPLEDIWREMMTPDEFDIAVKIVGKRA